MRRLSFQTRLFACFGGVLLFAIAEAAHSVYIVRSLDNQLRTEIQVASDRLDQSRQITIGLANMRTAMRGISLFSQDGNAAGVDKARSLFETSARQMQETTGALLASHLSAEDAGILGAIRSGLDQWTQSFPEFMSLNASGRGAEADALTIQKTSPIMDLIQKNAAEFARSNQVRRAEAVARSESSISVSTWVSLVLTALLTIVASLAIAVVGRSAKALHSIARSVSSGANEVASASAQISSASQSLARGTSEQAASLEETAAAAEQVTATAQRNQDNSGTAAGMVTDCSEGFEGTNDALNGMVVSMREISASSDKISRIIKVIDEIAFQTNILALNAAVEAARAGEAGAGFAVVADEVRNLAQRCAQAAQDTTALIEESIAKSSGGKSRVDGVAGSVREIVAISTKVKGLIDEVHSSSREQATGMEQIRHAVQQMEQATQRNAASAEETAAAAEELSAQSDALRDVARHLTDLVGSTD